MRIALIGEDMSLHTESCGGFTAAELDQALRRQLRVSDELREKMVAISEGLRWLESVLYADMTDCRKQDLASDVVRAILAETSA